MGFYAPQTKLREGNVFRNLYYSVLGGMGHAWLGVLGWNHANTPTPVRLASGKYPSYWNAVLFIIYFEGVEFNKEWWLGGGPQIYLRSTNQAENESHLKDINRNVDSPNWYSFDIAKPKGSVLHVLVLSSLLSLFRGLSIGLCEAFCIIISKVYYFARCPLLRSSGNKWTSEF